jgi:hypothetical protein
MDFLVLNRMPDNVKSALKSNETIQFYWETSPTKTAGQVVGSRQRILVHVMDTHYASPDGFNWEDLEHGPPIQITDDNIEERTNTFMDILYGRVRYYPTKHIMIPMGGDFTYQNATMQFENMERIFQHVHDHPDQYGSNVHFQYSTPREYQAAVKKSFSDANRTIPIIHGGVEFQPLLAGYYFQSPNLKQMLRTCEVTLRMVEVRIVKALLLQDSIGIPWNVMSEWIDRTRTVRETISMMQHHDAITATSYRFVIADYIRRLSSAFRDMTSLLSHIERQHTTHQHDLLLDDKIVGGGPYVHETVLIRDAQTARSVNVENIVNPQMGFEGSILAVMNSLPHETTSLVHFVCTRDDIAITVIQSDGSEKPVVSQVTSLDHELEVSNLGLFLVSFRANISGLGGQHYKLRVCDLTWTTFQKPMPLPNLQCAERPVSLNSSQLIEHGLFSTNSQVRFNASTFELTSITTLLEDGTRVSSGIDHDFVLYSGQNDTIYSFATSLASSDPPALFGSRPRRFVSAYKGPLFSQVTLQYTPWLSVRYRVTKSNFNEAESTVQVTVFAGPLPPSVNLASRFSTGWSDTEWFIDENGFLPVQVSYNSTNGVGDWNSRPLVSRSWINDPEGRRFSIFSVDPRAVASKTSGTMDVFWHRRNTFVDDWWKQGDDQSSVVSSVWLSLGQNNVDEEFRSRRVATQLSNDILVLAMSGMSIVILVEKDSDPTSVLKPNLHTITLRLSQFDSGIDPGREESWIEIRIENLSAVSSEEVDLSTLFKKSPKIFLEAATMHSLTYLSTVSTIEGPSVSGLKRKVRIENSSGCTLLYKDGGKHVVLKIWARWICSVRIPVSPVENITEIIAGMKENLSNFS